MGAGAMQYATIQVHYDNPDALIQQVSRLLPPMCLKDPTFLCFDRSREFPFAKQGIPSSGACITTSSAAALYTRNAAVIRCMSGS